MSRRAAMDNYNYWNDSRVIESMVSKPKVSTCRSFMIYEVGETEDGEPETIRVPTRFEVCPYCEGRGRHVNPSIDAGGLTQEDLRDWDDWEIEEYFSGGYDVTCTTCNGNRVVSEPDFSKISKEDAEKIRKWEREEREYAQMCAMERAMGA
jgi:hypothetical protein